MYNPENVRQLLLIIDHLDELSAILHGRMTPRSSIKVQDSTDQYNINNSSIPSLTKDYSYLNVKSPGQPFGTSILTAKNAETISDSHLYSGGTTVPTNHEQSESNPAQMLQQHAEGTLNVVDVASTIPPSSYTLLFEKILQMIQFDITENVYKLHETVRGAKRAEEILTEKLQTALEISDQQFQEAHDLAGRYDALKKQHVQLKRENTEMVIRIRELQNKSKDTQLLQTRIQQLQQDLINAKRNSESEQQTQHDMNELNLRLQNTTTRLATMMSKNAKLEESIAEALQRFKRLKSLLAYKKQRIVSKETARWKRRLWLQRRSCITKQFQLGREKYVSKSLSHYDDQVDEETKHITEAKAITLQQAVKKLSEQCATLKCENDALSKDLNRVETREASTNKRLAIAEEDITQKEQHIIQLEEQNKQYKNNIKLLEGSVDSTSEAVKKASNLNVSIHGKSLMIANLQKKLNERDQLLQNKTERINDLLKKLQALQEKHSDKPNIEEEIINETAITTVGASNIIIPEMKNEEIIQKVLSKSCMDEIKPHSATDNLEKRIATEMRAIIRDYNKKLDVQRDTFLERLQATEKYLSRAESEIRSLRQQVPDLEVYSSRGVKSSKYPSGVTFQSTQGLQKPQQPTKVQPNMFSVCLPGTAVTIRVPNSLMRHYETIFIHIALPPQNLSIQPDKRTWMVDKDSNKNPNDHSRYSTPTVIDLGVQNKNF